MHLVSDILISYGFFLKAYVIQKKFRYLNLAGDQGKLKKKCELTSCVSKQFNGMYTVRAMNQNNRRKDFVTVYIFIDCATSLKHYNNYYFSINPRSVFIAHYHEADKNIKRKQTFQCHYCDMFSRYKNKFIRHVKALLWTSRLYLYFFKKKMSNVMIII